MEEVVRLLQEIPPFSQLTPEQVKQIADSLQIEYFPTGRDILVYKGRPSEYLYIIQRGSVDLLRESDDDRRVIQIFDTLGEGEMFGYPSLIRKQPPIVTVRTREETLVYLLPAKVFDQARRDYPVFARFFASSVIERITHRLQAREASASPALFRLRLRDIIHRRLICADPHISLREAAEMMSIHNVSSLVINAHPPGILTDRDLRNRVLAKGLRDTTPVSQVMTSPVVTLPSDSLVFEALLSMFEHGFHHMPVTEDGRIVGLVTHTDILRQQSKSPLFLPRLLERAKSKQDLLLYAEQVTATVGALLEAGARVVDIGRVVAVAHDSLITRLLKDAECHLGSPPCPYGWLVLGHEGRCEQTLRIDQNNALMFDDQGSEGVEDYFAKLAEYVVEHLVACGFPKSAGDFLATNPRWCQPVHVWREYFEDWINAPKEHVLRVVLRFFDYRQVYGALDGESMLRPIIRRGRENRIFLGRVAHVAVQQHAPVSFFRKLVVDRNGEQHDVIDMKTRGTALVVNLARLFALEAGCAETNSVARLRSCLVQRNFSSSGIEELVAAFEVTSLLRLRYQYEQLKQGKAPDNLIPVSWLSTLERRELKEALWAIARIQRNVALEFQTELLV